MNILVISKNGEIEEKEYNERLDKLKKEEVKQLLQEALGVYGNSFKINEQDDSIYDVELANGENVTICARALTPGGREKLKDEQRIQPKSKQVNYIYNCIKSGKHGVIIGIYKGVSESILVAWKVNHSKASNENIGVSKQIKLSVIAEAMKQGFAQCKNRGKEEYVCAFQKEFLYFYLKNSNWIHENPLNNMNQYIEKMLEKYNKCGELAYNRIVFGAPGTGKSYLLNTDKEIFGDKYERVTFHANYSYGQFVGAYKPVSCIEGITYEYVPGPFMRILVNAMKSKKNGINEPYLLIIEELNRANVASVFGEIFQLLDRDANGVSEYEIEASEEMQKYIQKELDGDIGEYKKIKIPNNMYIWATMNSADQGVFPMDTAFKRRWDFEYIGVDENKDKIEKIEFTCGEDKHIVNWNELREGINEKLLKYNINEDKLLGPFFISKVCLKADENSRIINNKKFLEKFKSKVIMYLFEDAVGRQRRNEFFKECGESITYSKICKNFDRIGEKIFGLTLSRKENKDKSNDE